MAFMDAPDFRTDKEISMLHAGFEAGLQSDSSACLVARDEDGGGQGGFERCLKRPAGGKADSGHGGGSGLGAAMGRRFVELGAELIICGRRLELLEATAAQMRGELGGKVAVFRCDIRDGAAVDAMMEQIWREAPIDVLVNNAAATFIAQSEHLSFRAADAILAPTLHGTMYCTLAAGRRWIESGHQGVVLSHSFDLDHHRPRLHGSSSMAKSAVLAMTRSLAVEWGPKGVRTVAIAPGAFPTPGASGQLRPEGPR
jgi:NAD(P)-dependent dehydrogenase (short-subunit alcohol dehydrogenase family)